MPEFESEKDVINALVESQNAPDTPSDEVGARAREVAAEQAEVTAPESDDAPEEQPEEDSFTGLNPTELPPELRPYYDSMLADYRRKTQGVAEQRRQYEALDEFGGVETATQALEWISSLQNPENALELHRELTAALQEQGYTLEQAKEEASRQVEQAQEEEDEFSLEGTRDPRVDELTKKIEELDRYREEEQERNLEMMMAAQYERDEAELISANPEYKEEDIENVYKLAFATGGNLKQADELYKGIQSHLLGRYIEEKQRAPAGSVRGSGPAETPVQYKTLDDPKLMKDVMDFVNQETAAGE